MEGQRPRPLTPRLMCFSTPKPPSANETGQAQANIDVQRQRMAAEEDNAAIKAANKDVRMQDQLALLSGKIGRKSLFSGGQGGKGYAAPQGKSLFVTNGGLNPPPPTGGGHPPPRPVPRPRPGRPGRPGGPIFGGGGGGGGRQLTGTSSAGGLASRMSMFRRPSA